MVDMKEAEEEVVDHLHDDDDLHCGRQGHLSTTPNPRYQFKEKGSNDSIKLLLNYSIYVDENVAKPVS